MSLYQQLAANARCPHLLWHNRRPEHAHFVREHLANSPEAFREHPEAGEVEQGKQWNDRGELRHHWFYQVRRLGCVCMHACQLLMGKLGLHGLGEQERGCGIG